MKFFLFTLLILYLQNSFSLNYSDKRESLSCLKPPIPVEDTLIDKAFYDGPYMKWKKDKSKIELKYFIHPANSNRSFKDKYFIDADSSLVHFKGFDYDKDITYYIHKNREIEKSVFDNVSKIFAVGDVHGEYDEVIDLLINAEIIDEKLNWIFGDGHVVFIGDLFDRGDQVTEILWFVYNLEYQAEQHGGKVHLILGNHEAMMFFNDKRYLAPKYKYFADYFNFTLPSLINENTILGEWLLTKNTAIRINDILFVHAGFSPQLNALDYSLDELNDEVRNLLKKYKVIHQSLHHKFMFGYEGPLWYRGYVVGTGWSDLVPLEELEKTLAKYQVSAIIHGHTGVRDIMQNFNGKVFNIHVPFDADDVLHKGLLITKEGFITIDVNGKRKTIRKR